MNPSERIDELIAELTDWRGKTLAGIRKSILEADREIIEEWKWMGSPVWSHDGIVAVANAHKEKVKLTFAHGAKLPDPDKLFNAGLGGNARRAIDFFEGDRINAILSGCGFNVRKLLRAFFLFLLFRLDLHSTNPTQNRLHLSPKRCFA